MSFSTKKTVGVFCLSLIFISSCTKSENANQNNNSSPNGANAARQQATKDDVEELGKIVRLSFFPEEATYREDVQNAPNTKKLAAVLKFSDADAAQIVAQAEKYKPADAANVETEDWFPAELVAQSQLSGDETLHGAVYAANDFFQPPYTDGKLTRIGETDYFVLELNAAP